MWRKAPIGHPMNKSLFGFGITALILSVASVSGQQLGTVDQARAMLDRAITALKSNEATALSEFNDPNNKQFHEHDLYVFCYDISDGKITTYESPASFPVWIEDDIFCRKALRRSLVRFALASATAIDCAVCDRRA